MLLTEKKYIYLIFRNINQNILFDFLWPIFINKSLKIWNMEIFLTLLYTGLLYLKLQFQKAVKKNHWSEWPYISSEYVWSNGNSFCERKKKEFKSWAIDGAVLLIKYQLKDVNCSCGALCSKPIHHDKMYHSG